MFHRTELILSLIRREVKQKYRGSVFGVAWSFANPLILLSVYSFVFGVVFDASWGSGALPKGAFALLIFIGMMAHGLLAECMMTAPSLVVGNQNYVKKVVFPLEALSVVNVGAALFQFSISFIILIFFVILVFGAVPLTIFAVPVVVVPLVILTLGVSWLLSSFGVYLRDLSHIAANASTILFFLCPLIYPLDAIPLAYQKFLYLNPLTFVIETLRGLIVFGELPNLVPLLIFWLASVLVAGLALLIFKKLRGGFADVV